MFFYSRVLRVSRAVPTPGKDCAGAPWQRQMRMGEIALFSFDARSGRLLRAAGEEPQLPLQEICMVFGSRYTAWLSAKGKVMSKPHTLSALYDRRGRWLSTISREGETRRNPGLGLAWLLFQFPLMAIYGATFIWAMSKLSASYFEIDPIRVSEMSAQELAAFLGRGLFLGGFGRLLFEWMKARLVSWHAKAARAPVGSAEREKLYKRLAKKQEGGALVAPDVTLTRTVAGWPSAEKHEQWIVTLEGQGFLHFGQFFISEANGPIDFWFNPKQDLTAAISVIPTVGMGLAVFTRYEDGSSFSVINRDASGLDQHPDRKLMYLGPEATAERVIEHALSGRPEGLRRHPSPDNLLEDYRTAWRTYVEWRRQRGTTIDEYRRIDQRRFLRTLQQKSEKIPQV